LPYDLLERHVAAIINEVPGVNRVVLDIFQQAALDHRMGVEKRVDDTDV